MEDLLYGVHELTHACFKASSFLTGRWIRRLCLFSGRLQDPANAPLFRPPAGSGECAIVDVALYQARPQGSDSFLHPFVSLNF
jgi:hypothetical protein